MGQRMRSGAPRRTSRSGTTPITAAARVDLGDKQTCCILGMPRQCLGAQSAQVTTSGVNSDRHMTLLATWLVRSLGHALLASLVVPVVLVFLGVVSRQFWLIYIGLGIGPFVFAWRLTKASAPSPTG